MLGIISVYLPYWDPTAVNLSDYQACLALMDILIKAIPPLCPVVVAGDFNCALPRFQSTASYPNWFRLRGFNKYSHLLQTLMEQNRLLTAEYVFDQTCTFTYHRGPHRTHIDHVLVSQNLADGLLGCTILSPDSENLSPHLPITCKIVVKQLLCGSNACRTANSRVHHSRHILDWSDDENNLRYNEILACKLRRNFDGFSIDDLDNVIIRGIHDSATEDGCTKP